MLKVFSGIILITFLFWGNTFAQEKDIEGIVFNKDTQYRLNRVTIKNLTSGITLFNNTKGEFKLKVSRDDKIVASLQGYRPDTIEYQNQSAILFYLQRLAIPLAEVVVKDSLLSAQKKYDEIKKQFNSLNRIGNNRDVTSFSNGGIGFSIDAIWSAFSKEGKNARRLQEIMERDFRNNLIDQRFSKELIKRVTGLKDDKLSLFMLNYKPSYYFIIGASEYDLVSYIKMAHIRFKKDPLTVDISSLKPIEND